MSEPPKITWCAADRDKATKDPNKPRTLFAIGIDGPGGKVKAGGAYSNSRLCWQIFNLWARIVNGEDPEAAFKAVFKKEEQKVEPDAKPRKRSKSSTV